MKKIPVWLIAILMAPVLIVGGINLAAPEISETVVFRPQPRPAKAANQTQLDQFWLDNAKATTWRWAMDITTPEPGVTRLKSSDPAATFLAQDARHGFITYGKDRLSYTSFTRAEAKPDPNRPLIVECTGNAMDRYGAGVSYAQKALPWGDVLMFDYPGYGDSTGKPSAESLEAASAAVIAHARQSANGRKIVLWGHSLGGFVCGKMASQMPEIEALILETTARSARDVVRAWTPAWMRPFVFPRITSSLATYDTAKSLQDRKFPTLVLGAGQDTVLPVDLSRALATAIKAQGNVVTYAEFPQALHWNVPRQADYRGVMTSFFGSLKTDP